MLTAEIKVNGKMIALVKAQNVGVVDQGEGDFEFFRVCEYACSVESVDEQHRDYPHRGEKFLVRHDRRFGWQGLIAAIAKEITPTVIETITIQEGGEGNEGVHATEAVPPSGVPDLRPGAVGQQERW